MLAVARAAGVSKGLLHYHFRSKEHLLLEAQKATFRQIHARFDERFNRGEVGLDTAIETLDTVYEAVREMRAWTPFMVETMSMANVNKAAREDLDNFYDETMKMLEDGTREVFRNDADTLAVPPPRLARLVRVAIHGFVLEFARAESVAELAEIDRLYADMRELFRRVALSGPVPEVTDGTTKKAT